MKESTEWAVHGVTVSDEPHRVRGWSKANEILESRKPNLARLVQAARYTAECLDDEDDTDHETLSTWIDQLSNFVTREFNPLQPGVEEIRAVAVGLRREIEK